VQLNVKGAIPAYAAGVLYRTGPGSYKVDTEKGTTFALSHWFDGHNEVHRFELRPAEDGTMRVFYNSRHTVDERINIIKKTGSLKGFTFGQKNDPCKSYFKKFMSFFDSSDVRGSTPPNVGVTLSVNMPGFDGQTHGQPSAIEALHTKTDASLYQKIDPQTLEPIGIAKQESLHPDLKGPLSAAHAKSDPLTGDIYNFNMEIGRATVYRVFCVSASTGKTSILASFSAPPAYLHSVFLTPDHVILCLWSSQLSKGGLSMLYHHNILDAIAPFDASKPATWYVIDRKNGKGVLATYESPAFFCFHTINAYLEASPSDPSEVDIIADLAAYDSLDVLKRFYYENLLSTSEGHKQYRGQKGDSTRPSLTRYRLPSVPTSPTTNVKQATIDFSAPRYSSPELPTLNPRYFTKKHRYTYGVADRGKAAFVDGLVKFDNDTRTPLFWERHGHSPGEPIFVADPECGGEDDGVLLSVVLDGHAGLSYLLVLDARTMEEVGRAEVDGVVGFGFHGVHVSSGGGTGDF